MLSRVEAEDFLFHEAHLLDDGKLEQWLDLFAPEGVYWLPIDDAASPDEATSLIYDLPLRRRERVWRLLNTVVHAQTLASRTCHSITNVRVEEHLDAVRVFSSQVIYEIRPGSLHAPNVDAQPRAIVARCEHRLQQSDGRLLIGLKKLVLLNRDLPLANLTFVL